MDPWSNTATDTGNYPYLSLFSSFLSLLSLSFSHYLITQQKSIFSRFLSHENRKRNPTDRRHRIQQIRLARLHELHYGLFNVKLLGFFFSCLFIYLFIFPLNFFSTVRATTRRSLAFTSNVRARLISCYVYHLSYRV